MSQAATVALKAIAQGVRSAHELESETLDFKQDGQTVDETVKVVVDAVLCFANSRGGDVVVGVADKLKGPGAIIGTALSPDLLKRRVYELTNPPLTVGVSTLVVEGRQILVVGVPESPEVHSDKRGRAPRRLGAECHPMAPYEVARLREERMGIDWSAAPTEHDVTSISPEALASVRQRLSMLTDMRRAYATLSDEDLLRALGVVDASGRMLRAGELMLCTPSNATPPALVYQFRLTPGGEPKKTERISFPLVTAFDKLMAMIQARQDVTQVPLPDGQILTLEDFPGLAVREACVNALIHRDYRLAAEQVSVEHSPSAFVVSSPGPLVSGVTPQNILTHPSKPRNPLLAHVFRLLGFAEQVGRGVDRMVREMIRSGREIPRIDDASDHVRVTLIGGVPNASIARFVAQHLPQAELEDTDTMLVLFTLCTRSSITAAKLSPILQKGADEAQVVLRRLSQDSVGIVEPVRQRTTANRPRAYRLRAWVVQELGSAVEYHRRTVDDIDRKVMNHVAEYGKITNKTVQNLFDVDVQKARWILTDLVGRHILVKTSLQQRGPGIEYGPGVSFPVKPKRRRSQ